MQTWCCPHMVCKFKPPFQGQNHIFATLSLYQSYGGWPRPLKVAGCNEEIISFNLSILVFKAMFKAIVQSKWLWRTFRNFWAQITWCYLVTWHWATWVWNFYISSNDASIGVPKTAVLRATSFGISAKKLVLCVPNPTPRQPPALHRLRWNFKST